MGSSDGYGTDYILNMNRIYNVCVVLATVDHPGRSISCVFILIINLFECNILIPCPKCVSRNVVSKNTKIPSSLKQDAAQRFCFYYRLHTISLLNSPPLMPCHSDPAFRPVTS